MQQGCFLFALFILGCPVKCLDVSDYKEDIFKDLAKISDLDLDSQLYQSDMDQWTREQNLTHEQGQAEDIPTNNVLVDGVSVSPKFEDNCRMILKKFSESSSAFTRCANQYAKPIYMCRKCVQDFIDVRKYYNALEHSESEGINCKDILTSHDKVEIIKVTYEYIVGKNGLWSKAYCSSCYTRPLNYESTLTEKAVKFFALARAVQDCFDAHPNKGLDQNKSEACFECQVDYAAFNAFYKEELFKAQFPYLDGICFDIVDTMNTTQRQWGSDHFDCGRKMKGNAPLIIAVCCVLLSPVAFYILARLSLSAARERTVAHSYMSRTLSTASRLHRASGVGSPTPDMPSSRGSLDSGGPSLDTRGIIVNTGGP